MKIAKKYTLILWGLALIWLLYSIYLWFSTSVWKVDDLHQLIGAGLIFIAASFMHFPRTNDRISPLLILFTAINIGFGIFAWFFPSTMHAFWNYAFLSFGIQLVISIDDGIMQHTNRKWMRLSAIILGVITCLPALLISTSFGFNLLAVFTLAAYSILILIELFKKKSTELVHESPESV